VIEDEEDISAAQSEKKENARIQEENEHEERQIDTEKEEGKREKAPIGLRE
jgi:hypothetical protein